MKSVFESTPNGCKITLSYEDKALGQITVVCNYEKTKHGVKRVSESIESQFQLLGYSDEVIRKTENIIEKTNIQNFIILANELQKNEEVNENEKKNLF